MRVLPGLTAPTAGKSAWLTGILAFPAFLLLAWMLFALVREGGGLAEAFQKAFGALVGKGITIIYMVWALFLLCLEGRLYAGRMLSAGYQSASPAAFLLVLLALTLWMGRRKLGAFARTAEICYLVLALTLGLVLLFSILDITPEHVLPVWFSDLPGAAAATLVPVGVLSCGVFGGFLAGKVTRRGDDGPRGLRWLAAGCLILTLLQFGALAQLGAGLCARMDAPFFEVARGVGIDGAFQRVESIVVALWVFSDFALLGLLVFAIRYMSGSIWGEKGERWAPILAVILALVGGLFLFADDFAAQNAAEMIVPLGNLFLSFPVPALALLMIRLRHRKN